MNVLKLPVYLLVPILLIGCGGKNNTADTGKGQEITEEKEAAVSNPMEDKGIGPIKSLEIPAAIDEGLVAKGKEIFELKCTACHKVDKKYIGPGLQGVVKRRTPEWIMNMILNPEEMVQKNAIAKQLLLEFNGSPMANQNLTEEEARAVLEYFRKL